MRPGAVKIESLGSLWWFDESAHEYLRLPKQEAPRDTPHNGILQDGVWHPYERFEIRPSLVTRDPALYIYVPSQEGPAFAPCARRVS